MSKRTKYISLLRGINIGGKRKILMADLKDLYSTIGFSNCISYIQSGNVIFECEEKSTFELAHKIEDAVKSRYGFDVPVIVITTDELKDAVQANPYIDKKPIESIFLTFLKQKPEIEFIDKISKLNFSPDKFQIINRNAFIYCPESYHKTKLSNKFFESKLKVSATTRNWKTIRRLLELSSKE